ncbi:MAG: shikimate dehydrogenase [Actinomycetota bacterium]
MDAGTALLGVVGHPVAHSLSPAFWEPALRHDGRNAVFLAFDVQAQDFAAFVEGMRVAGARGFNVTVPHKGPAFDLSTERSEAAEGTGAVNVLVFEEGKVMGSNTDVQGVVEAVRDLGVELGGSRALVLGAGGAGRAAAFALARSGAEVRVANRTPQRARELGHPVVEWADVPDAAGDFDLIVHTTTVGMDGESSVLGQDVLRSAAGRNLRAVLDVVYRPDETPLVRAARAAGLRTADGLRMLVHQAAEAWQLFFGSPAPADVMHEAAAAAAGRR